MKAIVQDKFGQPEDVLEIKEIDRPVIGEDDVLVPYYRDIATQIHRLRSVKSEAEIEKIRRACEITHVGFSNIPNHARIGQSEREICKQMRIKAFFQ